MSKVLNRHGTSITCDVPKCKSKFFTYSVSWMARPQAVRAGWRRESGRLYAGSEPGIYLSNKKIDICPDHPPDSIPRFEKKTMPKNPKWDHAEAVRTATLEAVTNLNLYAGRNTLSDLVPEVNKLLKQKKVKLPASSRQVDRALQHHRRLGEITFGKGGWRLKEK